MSGKRSIKKTKQRYMKILLFFLLLSFATYSQWDNKTFRPYYNDYDQAIGVKVGHPEDETIWLLYDVAATDRPNLLDQRTQDSMKGIGTIISPVVNRGLFNYAAAQDVCPVGWRLPRIGEWDTLTNSITFEQLNFMFSNLKGFIGYSTMLNDSSIVKNIQRLRGGYWWTSDTHDGKLIGMELTNEYVWRAGYLQPGDCAAVRCIKEDDDE